jgi:hypothetical protein
MKKLLLGILLGMALFIFNACTETKDTNATQKTEEPSEMKCETGKCGGEMKEKEITEQSGNNIPDTGK